MEVFLCAAAIYLALNFLIGQMVALLEYRLSTHMRAVRPRLMSGRRRIA
jgi:octopine/nopaline transport system permease protein